MLYSASFDRLRPKSTRKRRRSNGGGAEDAAETDAPAKSSRTALSTPSTSSTSQGSSGSSTKGFKKEYCRLKTLVPALSDREDLSKASEILFCNIEIILELNKSFQALLGN